MTVRPIHLNFTCGTGNSRHLHFFIKEIFYTFSIACTRMYCLKFPLNFWHFFIIIIFFAHFLLLFLLKTFGFFLFYVFQCYNYLYFSFDESWSVLLANGRAENISRAMLPFLFVFTRILFLLFRWPWWDRHCFLLLLSS